ncbi:MAG: HAMP domain-containing protein [Treponema sp.]|nr:HAMP domain-containing protein [Treponema sp.]
MDTKDKTLLIRFSIRAKLVTIISTLVLASLGAITVLVSVLVSQDLRLTAEENNFEVNRRTAIQAENTLAYMRSSSLVLLQTINVVGGVLDGENGQAEQARLMDQVVQFFFRQNHHVAALIFFGPGQSNRTLVNDLFAITRGIEDYMTESWFEKHPEALERASAGETILLSAASDFSIPMLALIFPWRNGGAGVLFSPESLNDVFGFGINQSYLINSEGDILIHADFALIQAGANVANQNFIQAMRRSPQRSQQTLYTDSEGVRHFGAFTKLNIASAAVVTSIEYDKVFEGIVATTQRNAYLTITVLSISILLIWFFAKTISVPLKALAAAARAIEGGTFEVKLKAKGRDEIGLLTNSFKRMSTALSIFGKFTNRDLAIRAMRGELKPGGQHKHATIFFSDIRDFTEKSEDFTREFGDKASDKIVFWLNDYLTRMVECVEKTGGIIDKFIGDAVMAHWGTAYTAGSPRRDAFNCIKAALLMRMALIDMNKKRKSEDRGNPSITIGCGINTGIVTAGQIGSDVRMEYTVIGDPVNLASRTEALNKPLGTDILITENTWELVKDYVITEEMPSVWVKGKEKPVRLFAVVNLTYVRNGPRTLAEVRQMLGLQPPDLSKVNIGAEEIKYRIGEPRSKK